MVAKQEAVAGAVRELRAASRRAMSAAEVFLRWSYQLEGDPEQAVKNMRKATTPKYRTARASNYNEFTADAAERVLCALDPGEADGMRERATKRDKEATDLRIGYVARRAARNALDAAGHAPGRGDSAGWRKFNRLIDAAAKAAMKPDHIEAIERGEDAEQEAALASSRQQDDNVVAVDFGGQA